jgi:superfamily I DNA/RNA helicase
VHGFKGREANTVFLTLDCTPRVEMAAYIKEILDDELRVWYTAVTRAKETLYLIGQNEFITT